jgi:hypothetical protein
LTIWIIPGFDGFSTRGCAMGCCVARFDKWLAAGVLEGEELSHPDAGTPQGGVVSPCLANIYLHDALDTWFERHVKPRLQGRAFLLRFAIWVPAAGSRLGSTAQLSLGPFC